VARALAGDPAVSRSSSALPRTAKRTNGGVSGATAPRSASAAAGLRHTARSRSVSRTRGGPSFGASMGPLPEPELPDLARAPRGRSAPCGSFGRSRPPPAP